MDVEHRARCWSGDWKWLLSRGKVVERDSAGKPVRMVGTILDITEHKQNQERVRSLTRALIETQEREAEARA
jgi:PAS domain-containing protein